ncbi:reverse transcriptase domain-containing protein [Tanacetum coccineum]
MEPASRKHHIRRASSRRTKAMSAKVWFDDLPSKSINSYDELKKAFLENFLQQKKCIKDLVEIHHIKQREGESMEDFVQRKAVTFNQRTKPEQWERSGKGSKKRGNLMKGQATGNLDGAAMAEGEEDRMEGPMIIEVEMGGHFVHYMYVDGNSSSEILYEHYFNRFRLEVKSQMVPAATSLVGFSGEIIWPLGQIPLLVKIAPKEKEELIIYLAATKEAISAVLMTERDGKQVPIYFVSRALQGPELNYTPMEKLILALILSNPEVTGRLLKWSFELGEHDIHYQPRTFVKEQILADFIVERPEDDPQDTPMKDKEELLDSWLLFTDGSSCIDGSGAGLILTNPEGVEFTYALRFRFNVTNNESEYEALIASL